MYVVKLEIYDIEIKTLRRETSVIKKQWQAVRKPWENKVSQLAKKIIKQWRTSKEPAKRKPGKVTPNERRKMGHILPQTPPGRQPRPHCENISLNH